MPKERNAFKLGLVAIVVVTLFVAAVLFIGGASFEKRRLLVVRIAHDQPMPRIKSGAPIICGPQQVGVVRSVAMVEGPALNDAGVQDFLYFEVRGEVSERLDLRSDCRVVVEGPLLGDNGQLSIAFRGSSTMRVSPETPIYARASGFASNLAMITDEFDKTNPTSLLSRIKSQLDPGLPQAIVTKVHRSLDDLNAMSNDLRILFDPARDAGLVVKIDSILSRLNDLTGLLKEQLVAGDPTALLGKLHRGLEQLDAALTQVTETVRENRSDLRATVSNLQGATRTLDQEVMPAVAAELDRTDAESLLSGVRGAVQRVDRSLADVEVMTGKARKIVTLGEGPVLTLIANVKEASEHLKAAAKDLRRNPWRLIHKPDAAETREAQVLEAVREFTELSANLDDLVSHLQALAEAEQGRLTSDDPTLTELRERIRGTLERYKVVEQALWEQLERR